MKYAFTITRVIEGKRRKDKELQVTLSSWYEDKKALEEKFDMYWSMLKFAPWIHKMTIIDEDSNILEERTNARSNY